MASNKPDSVLTLCVSGNHLSDAAYPCFKPEQRTVYTYFALLRVGFSFTRHYCHVLCALTAHFHPYLDTRSRRFIFCGTFHKLTPPILVSSYGTLFVWSPDFPPAITTRATTSDHLACHLYQRTNICLRIRHLCKNVQCALKDSPIPHDRH